MGKTLSELIEKTSASNSDVLLIEDATSTNKITKANFLKDLVNKTDILSQRVEAVEKLKESSELEVTTENGYVVCENTNNGQIKDLKIEGRTLIVNSNNEEVVAGTEGATLKSVGDGVDKIEVLSRKEDGNLFDGQLELGNRLGTTGELNELSTNVRSKGKYSIRVKPSVKYTVDMNITYVPIWVYEYAKDGSFIQRNYLISTNKSFTTTSRTAWLGFNDASSNTLTLDTRFMIYEAKNNPTYIFNQNKKQILYQTKEGNCEKPILRSTGNVSDSIEKHGDGKYYFHKRCGEVVLNGSEEWKASSGTWIGTNTISFYTIPNNGSPYTSENTLNALCDKFTGYSRTNLYNSDIEGVMSTSSITIRINKSKLSTQDTQGFKTWLQSNNVTVVYQLATEEVYKVVNLDLDSYEGETSVIVDSGAISPKMTFKIASHIANTVQVLKDRINYLEDKVMNMFKAVLCGDVQTLAYELYPEDFEEKTTESIEGTELL